VGDIVEARERKLAEEPVVARIEFEKRKVLVYHTDKDRDGDPN
jgi:hypothetical protein